jgi:protein-tyrosine phosphatase
VIDIHCHLLPGVDDGSPSVEKSLPVLQRFSRDGVKVLVLTPHLLATEAHKVDMAPYDRAFESLRAAAPPLPELRRGWEIMLDAPGTDLRGAHLALGESNAVLVEFPRMNVPARAAAEIHRLTTLGLIPVLAHPERYWGCTPARVVEWRNAGATIQMDAVMLLSNGSVGKLARVLLEQGLVDVIASDNHGDVRSLAAARNWLEEMGADEQVDMLTSSNAQRLLNSERALPVPPLQRIGFGMLGRLKELLRGGSR